MHPAFKHSTLAFAIAAGIFATSASHAEAVSEQRTVAAFKAVELFGPYHVVIRAQGKQALELSGERKQLADVETIVTGNTLIVRPVSRNGFHFSSGRHRPDVTIHITASTLASLRATGSGDVELDQVSGDQFSVSAEGPGDVRASGAARELAVTSRGSGNLDLHQFSAVNVNLAMSGPGDVTLSGVGGELTADVRGSGDLHADALRLSKLTARLRGPGNATLAGSSRELRAEVFGSGDLEAHGLTVRDATVRSRGPGEIQLASVTESLDADLAGSGGMSATLAAKRLQLKMSGPGDVHLAGTVDSAAAQLTGSGSLDGRRLAAGNTDVTARGPGSAVVNVRNKGADRLRQMTIDRSGMRFDGE